MLQKMHLIICLVIFILLSSCVNRNNEYSNFSCRNKNSSCYRQFGKQYKILSSSHHYQEKGVASWYGRQFHKKVTSSGERFNMYKLTAAHKTLPLSSYVQVTNLKNGKKVIVRINDRGPFIGNRLIDLSYAAAKKLGMTGEGVVPVSVKAV